MQRLVVERATTNQRLISTARSIRPVSTIRQRRVPVEPLQDLPISKQSRISLPLPEPHDLEPIMHARHQQIILPLWCWMPLDAPGAASHVRFSEGLGEGAGVEEADGRVVAAYGDEVLDVRVALDRRYA